MFDVGGGEILLIVLAILLLFGPRKIPEIASMVGNGMRKVRKAQDDFTQHLRDMSTELEVAELSTASADSADSSPISGYPLDPPVISDASQEVEGDPSGNETPDTPSTVAIQPAPGSVSR